MPADDALVQELRHHLRALGAVKAQLAPAQAVARVVEQLVQRHDHIAAGQVGGDMVRIGDAHVRRGLRGDVGDDVVVDAAVVRVQAHFDPDVRIEGLKVRDGLLIYGGLHLVGIVLRPEGHFKAAAVIQLLRDHEGAGILRAVAAGQRHAQAEEQEERQKLLSVFHPLSPPLDTPAMIFLWNTRKRMISGTEMTTTAAIIAGIFSRPKPFSRISWMPLDTR